MRSGSSEAARWGPCDSWRARRPGGGPQVRASPWTMARILPPLPPLRDRIRPGLRLLFVGINPGVRSSLTGHHFAGYSNRFWRLLHESGLVPEPIGSADDDRLPEWGFGITNIVARPTPGIDTLAPAEYVQGRARLRRKIGRYRPEVVALVGITVYRALFPERRGRVTLGPQAERVCGAAVFVLPNPSGRNANYSHAEMLAAYVSLRRSLGTRPPAIRAGTTRSTRAARHRGGRSGGSPAGRGSARRGCPHPGRNTGCRSRQDRVWRRTGPRRPGHRASGA